MRDLFKELQYGARALGAHPGFTAVAVASLAEVDWRVQVSASRTAANASTRPKP